ncbi:GPW/gp25 family protein (plasmid) [Kitasatospora sp. NBC_00070]|uniref:GPW/gp25 family protein n=1 Tax=Kitasatospora sp. NBC_00070 TaxID=2975962 RepID=UPI002F918E7B
MNRNIPDFAGSGWAFPMGVTASGGIATVSQEATIIKAMRLILTTYPGERPMRPDFGSHLRDYVFRSIDGATAAEMAHDIRESLLRWEPRVVVEFVDIQPDAERPEVAYIDIQFTVKTTNDRRNLVFPFYSIPDDERDY